jgi:predicted Zn-dependent protease
MKTYFYELVDFVGARLQGSEQYQCWYSAEASDFVRFNRSAIRQSGHVRQAALTLHLINGRRHGSATAALAGHLEADSATIEQLMATLRAQLPDLPEDPHLLVATEVHSTEFIEPSRLPDAAVIVDQVLRAATGVDLVGILAMGPMMRGFANAAGQRNWHQSATFNLGWSLYQSRDKAVKCAYAGSDWSSLEFAAKMQDATAQLALLQRPPVTVKPGAYRAFLTPTALQEIIGMFNWDGLSEKSLRTHQSSLRRMRDDGVRLNPAITLCEDTLGGVAPGFGADGFIKPPRTALIEQGVLTGSMISPRTAMEYGLVNNGAGSGEAMVSMDLAGGTLPMANALAELGTGIFVSNLWYLNFSDRASCRITGMTRFATFWVEDGEIKAPLNVMRFDESVFRLLGDKLLALTTERELLIDSDSWGERANGSARLPGALVKDFMFVL